MRTTTPGDDAAFVTSSAKRTVRSLTWMSNCDSILAVERLAGVRREIFSGAGGLLGLVGKALASAAGASECERGPQAKASAPAISNEMASRVFMSRWRRVGAAR